MIKLKDYLEDEFFKKINFYFSLGIYLIMAANLLDNLTAKGIPFWLGAIILYNISLALTGMLDYYIYQKRLIVIKWVVDDPKNKLKERFESGKHMEQNELKILDKEIFLPKQKVKSFSVLKDGGKGFQGYPYLLIFEDKNKKDKVKADKGFIGKIRNRKVTLHSVKNKND